MREEKRPIKWIGRVIKGTIIFGTVAGFMFFQSPVKATPSADVKGSVYASVDNSYFSAKCGGEKKAVKKDSNSKCEGGKCGEGKCGDGKCGTKMKKADTKKENKSIKSGVDTTADKDKKSAEKVMNKLNIK